MSNKPHRSVLAHSPRITRRGFIYIASVSGAAAFLAACGGQAAAPTAVPATAVPATAAPATAAPPATAAATSAPAATTAATAAPAVAIEKEMYLYNWSAYVNPANVDAFTKQFGTKITEDDYASNEDLLAKVEAGGTGYDVVVPTGYMVKIMAEKGLLLPLDWSQIPNAKYISPPFDKGRPTDPDNKWSVTKDWGTFGIMWNSDKVKEDITSWDDLWKLAPKYTGKIWAVDSSPEVLGAALKYLGYSYNSTDPKEIDAALKKLFELKPFIRAFDSTYIAKMANEEAWITLGWNGDAFAANAQRKDAGKSESIQYIIPKEGSEVWEDDWSILKGAPHPNAAHAFINFVLEPHNQALESNFTYYASGEEEAKKYINPDVVKNAGVYPPAEVIAKLEPAKDLPKEALQYREEAWTKLKSA